MAALVKTKPKAKAGLKTKPKPKPKVKAKTALSEGYKLSKEAVWEVKEKAVGIAKNSGRNEYLNELQESGLLHNRIPGERGVWQLQDAKAMFSEVIKATQDKPQIITVHGKEAAVILSYDEFIRLTTPEQSLYELIRNSPLYGVELELPPRLVEPERDINL